jgi:hypothetical protein
MHTPLLTLIIKQLSSDEAVILAAVDGTDYDFLFTQLLDHTTMLFGPRTIEIDTLGFLILVDPDWLHVERDIVGKRTFR